MREPRPDPDPEDLVDDLAKESQESLERAHELVAELKIVEEHEKKIIEGETSEPNEETGCAARI